MPCFDRLGRWTTLSLLLAAGSLFADHATIRVRVENLAPQGGVFFTPLWVAFHDGTFDIGDLGGSASVGLERLAEDGNNSVIAQEFQASAAGQNGGIEATIISPGGIAGPPVFDPGDVVERTFLVDTSQNRFFSYASMIIASNDAFFAELDATGEMLFDLAGNFTGPLEILIFGSEILDAGTEDNTEMDAAFLNQASDDTGVATVGGVISVHPGFIGSAGNPGGTPIILGGTNGLGVTFDPINADFTRDDYLVARISIVPELNSPILLGVSMGIIALSSIWRRRSNV